MELNPQQKNLITAVVNLLTRGYGTLQVSGRGGTGKTTAIAIALESAGVSWGELAVVCPTHEAKNVLARSLAKSGIYPASVMTVAGALGKVLEDPCSLSVMEEERLIHLEGKENLTVAEGKELVNLRSKALASTQKNFAKTGLAPNLSDSVVIVDEASMISPTEAKDLAGLGRVMIFLGDLNQVPYVGAKDGEVSPCLANPDITLAKVERVRVPELLKIQDDILACLEAPHNLGAAIATIKPFRGDLAEALFKGAKFISPYNEAVNSRNYEALEVAWEEHDPLPGGYYPGLELKAYGPTGYTSKRPTLQNGELFTVLDVLHDYPKSILRATPASGTLGTAGEILHPGTPHETETHAVVLRRAADGSEVVLKLPTLTHVPFGVRVAQVDDLVNKLSRSHLGKLSDYDRLVLRAAAESEGGVLSDLVDELASVKSLTPKERQSLYRGLYPLITVLRANYCSYYGSYNPDSRCKLLPEKRAVSDLRPTFALTTHKCQGNEFESVIVDGGGFLKWATGFNAQPVNAVKMAYTAVSRAKSTLTATR